MDFRFTPEFRADPKEYTVLTRLRVTGFKNLVDTEIHFGPLTCIAGYNGVGKSNIFDAIRFLSLLADHTFAEAARNTRGGEDIAGLFTVGGNNRMHFECDVLIPKIGFDDFHQPAEASHTFLTYELELELKLGDWEFGRIELLRERLNYVTHGAAKKTLGFPSQREWRESVIMKSHRRASYIETKAVEGSTRIRLSSDNMRQATKSNRGGGRPTDFLASSLPRTVLSAAQNSDEARTAVLVRSEMRSWRILQLEPTALRKPDELQAPSILGVDGRHLPATLYRMANGNEAYRVLADITNRLAELVSNVRELRVDRDDSRRLLQLVLSDSYGHEFSASSLSDGTLRFIALTVFERDPSATGVLCLEEPENGIHPERMTAMITLLRDMATDTHQPIGADNPLRQVVISTHSPVVVGHVSPDCLLFADHRESLKSTFGVRDNLVVRHMAETWRSNYGRAAAISKGEVLRYLGPNGQNAIRDDEPSVYQLAVQEGLFGAAL